MGNACSLGFFGKAQASPGRQHGSPFATVRNSDSKRQSIFPVPGSHGREPSGTQRPLWGLGTHRDISPANFPIRRVGI